MKHELPELKYNFNELEPYIDEMTMNIHYSKHHSAYVNNLNSALEKYPELFEISLEDLLASMDSLPENIKSAVRNNGGGHFNHTLFWSSMSPNGGGKPSEEILEKIKESFGGFEEFKEQFAKAALSRFGSGWVWLIVSRNGALEIVSSPNQDSPIFDGTKPILGLDVWEHAYYLKYQNRRADYINSWWNVVDWKEVEKRYSAIR